MAKKYFILIPKDSNPQNAAKEQFKFYQLDGETVQVPIGKQVEVPEWVAKRAKEIGEISDFIVVDSHEA